MAETWPEPSPRARELIRRGAELASSPPEEWLAELHAATLAGGRMRSIADDPALADLLRRSNVAVLMHWATHNLRHPGRRVPPNTDLESLEIARDLVRRGLDLVAIDTYRTGLNVAWAHWMQLCFALTDEGDDLREVLTITWRSISVYIDDTLDAITVRMADERDHLTNGSNADRLAAVSLILADEPIARSMAEQQLGYRLTGPHTAVIVWTTVTDEGGGLDTAARVLGRAAGSTPLVVLASVAALWLWLPTGAPLSVPELGRELAADPGVHLAIGRPGTDLEGFRRSHLDAAITQRMITRLGSVQRVARYDDIALTALITADTARAREYVRETLGELLGADPDTRETVAAYVDEQFNTSRTADRMYTHRNTVIRRLARADELLPRPLADNATGVAVALDVLRWLGDGDGDGARGRDARTVP